MAGGPPRLNSQGIPTPTKLPWSLPAPRLRLPPGKARAEMACVGRLARARLLCQASLPPGYPLRPAPALQPGPPPWPPIPGSPGSCPAWEWAGGAPFSSPPAPPGPSTGPPEASWLPDFLPRALYVVRLRANKVLDPAASTPRGCLLAGGSQDGMDRWVSPSGPSFPTSAKRA